jgi:DNA-binding transcriptional LysR family regulator
MTQWVEVTMNTRQIEYIIAIAEEKGISRASERLYISQSTLSQALLNLEKELGVTLFHRKQRTFIPTEAGLRYIQGAREMLRVKESTYADIRKLLNKAKERCRVGISSKEGMDRFLIASGKLQKQYLNVELYAIEDQAQNLLKKLKAGQLDIVIIATDTLDTIDSPFHVFRQEEILLVMPQKYEKDALDFEGKLDWNFLKDKKFILAKSESTMRTITDRAFEKQNIIPTIIAETGSVPTTLRMVEDDSGFSFVPKGLATPSDKLAYYSLYPNIYRYQIVIYRPSHDNNTMLRDFVQMLEDVEL